MDVAAGIVLISYSLRLSAGGAICTRYKKCVIDILYIKYDWAVVVAKQRGLRSQQKYVGFWGISLQISFCHGLANWLTFGDRGCKVTIKVSENLVFLRAARPVPYAKVAEITCVVYCKRHALVVLFFEIASKWNLVVK